MLVIRSFRESVRIRVLPRSFAPPFERPKPFPDRRHDSDVLALPKRRCRIWRTPAKPKQARNFKDLKGLKCRYTFGIPALISSATVSSEPDAQAFVKALSPNSSTALWDAPNSSKAFTTSGAPFLAACMRGVAWVL